MSRPASRLRRPIEPAISADPAALVDPAPQPVEPAGAVPEADALEGDPYVHGWREVTELAPDGSERRRRVPLTYRDLLDPQEGDFIAESTIHRDVTEELAQILKARYRDDPTVAVWRSLKIVFVIPGLTTGPGPDLCVVTGVHDRDRPRQSFRYGEEPGTVRLVVEVVSESSIEKDYEGLLPIYGPLGVEEYVAIRPEQLYSDGPFELRGWRLDETSKELRTFEADPEGRLRLETVGVLLGTGDGARGLRLWDAATGERLLTPEEVEARARQEAEERAEQEAEARRLAEERHRAEIERLRARLVDRDGA